MFKKGLALITAMIVFVSIVLSGGVGLGAPAPMAPLTTVMPTVTFPPASKDQSLTPSTTDAVVTISDSKLKAALHTATGIPAATPIKRSDLAKLTGGLDLSSKQITKLEGLQYCENITDLKLSDNKIADLPASLSKLTKLQTLIVDNNKLTKMPDAIFSMTKLTTLSLKNNSITKVSDKINLLTLLTMFDISDNKLENLPANISKLSQLKYLSLSGNGFATLSRDIFLLPALESLDLSNNVLKALPIESASAPKLKALNIEDNILDALPAGLGGAPNLQEVYASINRLKIVEPSLLNGKITKLTLDVNRITDLPTALSGKTFDTFSIEWNFIDMSEGSDSRKIADSVTAPTAKNYMRQLKILPAPTARASSTTVMLQWQLMDGGTEGDSSWVVNKYLIYIDKNGTWGSPIADVDKLAYQFVATNLKANTSYKFQVGVEYTLTLNGKKMPPHRFFTPVEIKTLASSATAEVTTEPTETPAPTEMVAPTPTSVEPAATDASVPAATKSSNSTLIIILIVAGALVAIVLVGVLMMQMSKRKQRPY